MTRPLPYCHRTFVVFARDLGSIEDAAHCLGSMCPLWLPVCKSSPGPSGRCSDNPDAVPWDDPQKKEKP